MKFNIYQIKKNLDKNPLQKGNFLYLIIWGVWDGLYRKQRRESKREFGFLWKEEKQESKEANGTLKNMAKDLSLVLVRGWMCNDPT